MTRGMTFNKLSLTSSTSKCPHAESQSSRIRDLFAPPDQTTAIYFISPHTFTMRSKSSRLHGTALAVLLFKPTSHKHLTSIRSVLSNHAIPFTFTHTHTHIYIYIYIYTSSIHTETVQQCSSTLWVKVNKSLIEFSFNLLRQNVKFISNTSKCNKTIFLLHVMNKWILRYVNTYEFADFMIASGRLRRVATAACVRYTLLGIKHTCVPCTQSYTT